MEFINPEDFRNSSYDEELMNSGAIKFLPVVGPQYSQSSPKILVLGESHYLDPAKSDSEIALNLPTYNKDLYATRNFFIEQYLGDINENGTHSDSSVRCYRNMAAMITGKAYNQSDYVWGKLAFYNFLQGYAGKGSNGKGFVDENMVEVSREAFFEVISILNPNLVIAWGVDTLYEEWMPRDDYVILSEDNLIYKYNRAPNVNIWHILHPSHGFSYTQYHDEFMKKAEHIKLDIGDLMA